jgi:radical SAM protein with 4Fe4S-binding SPASM domain
MLVPTIDRCISTLYQSYNIVCQIDCNYSSIETARLDLYSKLKLAFKQEYSNNERLIFVLEQDIYNADSLAGSVLQAIQVILQDIDISNYFVCIVTTNPDIELEYQYIKKIISTDPVGFHLHQCTGPFKKSTVEHTAIQGKIQSLGNVNLESLTEKQRYLLFVDPVFCIIPWTGINVDTTGKVYPCCEFDKKQPLGTTKTQSIDEVWHSKNTNSIRQSMLSGIPIKSCQSCYAKEKLKQPSLRNNFNKDLAAHVGLIESTDADGSIANTDISFWDIRYNNLCNFACRSCNPKASSSWYQIHNTLNPNKKLTVPLLTIETDQVFDQMCKNIDYVDTIYFAGGEPSMIENFYKI